MVLETLHKKPKDQVKRTPLKHVLWYIQSTADDMVGESVRTQTTSD